tara:strand:+ start:219 stop:560 length:342 start_codon:yes stop_codon:yes gene_type:complete
MVAELRVYNYNLQRTTVQLQARLAKKSFFWPAFVTRILTPRSRKSGYGLLLGCRSPLDAGPFEKLLFFDDVVVDVRSSNPKTGKIFTVCCGPASQSIGRGLIGREGALDIRES